MQNRDRTPAGFVPGDAAHKLGVTVDTTVRATYVRVDRVASAADFGAREDIFGADFCDLHLILPLIARILGKILAKIYVLESKFG